MPNCTAFLPLLLILLIGFGQCQYNNSISNVQLTSPGKIEDSDMCYLWSYDTGSKQCECYTDHELNIPWPAAVRCTKGRILLQYNFCMTFLKDNNTLSMDFCSYFDVQGHNISAEPGFISLPKNISELNNYMCGPMNRKGIVCSQCIEGYGISVTSTKLRCLDCTYAWYGVPLYIFLEVVPVTIFFLVVLVFQINLTSVPIKSFVLYSNIIIISINFNLVNLDDQQLLVTFLALFHGIWTLDFFRYAVPPFCISPKLKIIHVFYLQSVSTLLPYVLIAFTWLLLKLHSYNCKIAVNTVRLLKQIPFLKYQTLKWSPGRTVIDTFATFFFLSFAKVTWLLLIPLFPLQIAHINTVNFTSTVKFHSNLDPGVDFLSGAQLAIVVLSAVVFLFAILPPVIILTLYPIRAFRELLFRCCNRQLIASLTFFMDKYYSCFKDGLDGRRDMRSFASLYFFFVLLGYVLWSVITSFFLMSCLFGGCALMITIIQPYKKKHDAVAESLVLANLALIFASVEGDTYASQLQVNIRKIFMLIPAVGLMIFILYKLFHKPCTKILSRFSIWKSCLHCRCIKPEDNQVDNIQHENVDADGESELPHRLVQPDQYMEGNETAY